MREQDALDESECFIDATFASAKGGKGVKIMAIVDRDGLPPAVSTLAASHHEVTLAELLNSRRGLPEGVDLRGRVIYCVGPLDAVRDEAVGPAGPTTATRMDRFTDLMLEKTGLFAMVGKAERDRRRSSRSGVTGPRI